ncbi:hypothetical protein BDY21DRAFT_281209 [Lineolata rhizophorae]|uniref:protein disulfide-isomerase n=1 Tax=Lineolata rhizophorae TaxID=578093 RepID=A0A6A6P8I5_9PEZI|nr:hypothetical protein BDY21DRAFT_281209 [Lineolata rhizophorae]
MRLQSSLAAAAATLLLGAGPATAAGGLYSSKSPVMQVDAKSYDDLIRWSNYSSIIEFYAPWCGHCQNLKPAYEKAAEELRGFVNVAAVNCDDPANQSLCQKFGVQGFPTLKFSIPNKKYGGKPFIDDYTLGRTTKHIVGAMIDRMPVHMIRVTDKSIDRWLEDGNSTAKALYFTDKDAPTALAKSVATEFWGALDFTFLRKKEKKFCDMFGVTEFPTLLLLPGGDAPPVKYEGPPTKDAMIEFFSRAATPNSVANKGKKSGPKLSDTAQEPVESHRGKPGAPAAAPTPSGQKQQVSLEQRLRIATLGSEALVRERCLQPSSLNCLLVMLPETDWSGEGYPPDADAALASLRKVREKHAEKDYALFPFWIVTPDNPVQELLRRELDLAPKSELAVVQTNGKKSQAREYASTDYSYAALDNWIDDIRMGGGKRYMIPNHVVKTMEEWNREQQQSGGADEQQQQQQQQQKPIQAEDGHDEL